MSKGKRWLAALLCLVMLAAVCSTALADQKKKNKTAKQEGYKITFYARNGGQVLYTWQTDKSGRLTQSLRPAYRRGWHFMGWYTHPYQGYKITENTVFKRDTTVWAHWARVEGREVQEPGVYTVVFQEDENSRTLPSGMQTGEDGKLPEIPVPTFEKKKGKVFLGWRKKSNRELITADTVFTEDDRAIAIWGSAYRCTLTYISDGCVVGSREYPRGAWATSLMEPPAEEKLKKRTFLGWFAEPEGGEPISELFMMGNTLLYAHWSEPGWTITFSGAYAMDETGKSLNKNRIRTDSEGRLENIPAGASRGARFAGWYLDKNLTVPLTAETVFTRNAKVWAKTVKGGDNIKIRLNVQQYGSGKSKTVPEVLQVLPGEPVGTLPQPLWFGNGSERRPFLSWFTEDGTPVTADTVFTAETTIYAKWEEGHRVTFAKDADPAFRAAYTGADGKLKALPGIRKLVKGNPALGWYTADGEKVTSETVFSADTELTARWGYRILLYTEKAGLESTKIADLMTDDRGRLLYLPSAEHPKGYPFAGWADEEGNPVTEETVFTADAKIYGTWDTGGVKLIFQGGRGGTPDRKFMMTAADGTVDALPGAVHERGLPFLGWSTEEDGSAMVTEDTVFTEPETKLYAVWSPVFKITFRPNEGKVVGGAKAILTNDEGYVAEWPEAEHPLKLPFEGWYLSPRIKATPETKFTKDYWVDAKWGMPETRAGGYTLTLDDRGSTKQMKTADTGRVAGLSSPVRDDAIFYGWYTGPAATGMRLRNEQKIGDDLTVYAAWLIPLTEEEDLAQE